MAEINSYTGEVKSAPTTVECSDGEYVVRVERAVFDAIDIEPGTDVVLSGKVGDPTLTLTVADAE